MNDLDLLAMQSKSQIAFLFPSDLFPTSYHQYNGVILVLDVMETTIYLKSKVQTSTIAVLFLIEKWLVYDFNFYVH